MQSLVCTVIVKSIALNLARFSVVACALLLVVSVGYWSSALFVILSTEFVSCCVRRRFNSQLDTPKQGKHRNTVRWSLTADQETHYASSSTTTIQQSLCLISSIVYCVINTNIKSVAASNMSLLFSNLRSCVRSPLTRHVNTNIMKSSITTQNIETNNAQTHTNQIHAHAQTNTNTYAHSISHSLTQTRQYWREVLRSKPNPKDRTLVSYEDPSEMALRSARAQNAEGLLQRQNKFRNYEKPWMKRKRLKAARKYRGMNAKVQHLKVYVKYVQAGRAVLRGKKKNTDWADDYDMDANSDSERLNDFDMKK